jgi:sialidase-1
MKTKLNPLGNWLSRILCMASVASLLAVPCTLQGAEPTELVQQVLRKPGDDGSKAYRIPGLATTTQGTLLAVFDIRYDGSGDLPANIDVGLMRSTDEGDSWSAMQRILDFDSRVANSLGNGVGDPTIVVDRVTGTVFVAALWSQGNRGWKGSGPGMSPEETGQLVITKSTDDGLTWSAPINITHQVKEPAWRLCFNGPGAGIQLQDGTLVIPAQYRQADGTPHSCFIYSRDHGDSWLISPPAIPGDNPTSESQIAELDDGSLLLTLRDESRSGQRLWARWSWHESAEKSTQLSTQLPTDTATAAAGEWSEPWRVVTDPTCMASLIKHPNGKLLFSNPNHPTKRVAMTIRRSDDGGKSWSAGRLLADGECMYSCMTILPSGKIGILYEVDDTLTFAKFPYDWIEAGEAP